ncbi:hypothetical protein K488DRAFT_73591 [Vararia minispora EC-137]|uniref:Uncharacterized protein n=1 Tax=Vararia minispora EC-137 TaxID=1314806 RepID=A0ACB8QAQ9_9AGAM|nr:hypothetical protein K488DRAFT_73591 [Vararia minispora EC-137]
MDMIFSSRHYSRKPKLALLPERTNILFFVIKHTSFIFAVHPVVYDDVLSQLVTDCVSDVSGQDADDRGFFCCKDPQDLLEEMCVLREYDEEHNRDIHVGCWRVYTDTPGGETGIVVLISKNKPPIDMASRQRERWALGLPCSRNQLLASWCPGAVATWRPELLLYRDQTAAVRNTAGRSASHFRLSYGLGSVRHPLILEGYSKKRPVQGPGCSCHRSSCKTCGEDGGSLAGAFR